MTKTNVYGWAIASPYKINMHSEKSEKVKACAKKVLKKRNIKAKLFFVENSGKAKQC